MRLLAVIGRPIFFSQSPSIYNTGFKLLNIDARYVRFASFTLGDAFPTIEELGFFGFNVTSPFKEEIIPYLDEVDPVASSIGAVNTVLRTDRGLKGFNTDPAGVRAVLKQAGINLKGKKVLVLGAGGASRAALYTLKEEGVSSLWVTNRGEEKGRRVARELGSNFLPLDKLGPELSRFEVIISCLPRLDLLLPREKLPAGAKIIEAAYSYYFGRNNRFNSESLSFSSGLEWLLGQGIAALELFSGKKIKPEGVEAIREEIYRHPQRKNNLALIGFMGCGKSTVGRLLASALGLHFIETDLFIEDHAGLTIEEIFSRRGERGFRELEASLLPPLLERARGAVISLGGGAVKEERVVRALASTCHVIWLWSSFEDTWKRIAGSSRPLLKINPSPQHISSLLEERIPLYARSCDLLVANRQGELEKTVRLIADEISPALGD